MPNRFVCKMDKTALRKSFIKKRKALTPKQKSTLDDSVFQNAVKLPCYKQSNAVLVYVSTDIEVDTKKIIAHSLWLGKTVAAPKCIDNNGNMVFKTICREDDLINGMYGISEPKDSCRDYESDFENAVCFVPALSFDCRGFRLGYGKGYYDRFLKNFSGISIGLCYDDFLVDVLPINSYDIGVEYIVTESKAADVSQRQYIDSCSN